MIAGFVVPIHTGQGLNSREREHWAQRAARVKRERNAVALCFPREWRGAYANGTRRRLVVVLTRGSPGELDDDNLPGALKAIRDEVAKQLGLPGDRDPRVAWAYKQLKLGHGEYRVEVDFEEVRR